LNTREVTRKLFGRSSEKTSSISLGQVSIFDEAEITAAWIMQQELLKDKYIHADETVLQVMNKDGRKNTTDSYMWVYTTGQHSKTPIRIFEYKPCRSGEYPQKFLKGFKGYLHTDAYSGTIRFSISQDVFVGHIFYVNS